MGGYLIYTGGISDSKYFTNQKKENTNNKEKDELGILEHQQKS